MRKARLFLLLLNAAACLGLAQAQSVPDKMHYDISKDRVLYSIGYSHLDTQWNWDYPASINKYIKNTMTENFYLFDRYPDYVFSFTGSYRYHLMKEYYPDLYVQVKKYIDAGRWYVAGSSVDEAEAVVSSPESVIRQILYGNHFFKKEFGKVSADYLLPDCFGFPACLPTLLSYAGLKGFSTQKLSWGSAVGVPFNVGVWYGPDGSGLVSALNPGSYTSRFPAHLDTDEKWNKRLSDDKAKSGYAFDYMYYGVGDQGGAPRESDARKAEACLSNSNSKFKVVLTSSDQMFKDITPEIKKQLPVYTGDLLLTEHSAGSITSQAFMKKMNRKNEFLAQAAEQLAVMADWGCNDPYPIRKLNDAWELVLASQFHDILPGTSIPKAYEYSWNNEFIAANNFADVLRHSAKTVAYNLNTMVKGTPVVVYNPLAIEREDIVTSQLTFNQAPEALTVAYPTGEEVPAQIIEKKGNTVRFIFPAKLPSVGMAVFDVREVNEPVSKNSKLKITAHSLENEYYKVEIDAKGNISGLYDKIGKRQLLSQPATLDLLSEKSEEWPAWNMNWSERQKPVYSHIDKNVSTRIVENGPVRIALEVKREGENSTITQVLSLSSGESGKRLIVENNLDWQSSGLDLKAAFPLTALNDMTTYNMGVGTIERNINNEKKFEVPSKLWFDQTDKSGTFGVSILEDCKYGSDKPDSSNIRLTLVYSPKVNKRYVVQKTQDWGVHEFKYGIYAHQGDWREGLTPWQGSILNQPAIAFETVKHKGHQGKSMSFLSISSPQIGLMAFKKMEDSDYYLVRVNELLGKDAQSISLNFCNDIADAYEVNGQEERIGNAHFTGHQLTFDLSHYAIKSYAVKLEKHTHCTEVAEQISVDLPYNADVFSYDTNRDDGSMDGHYTMPAELMSDTITSNGIYFKMGSRNDEQNNALSCKGQTIALPKGDFTAVYLLAAAKEDVNGTFKVNEKSIVLPIQKWTGYIGQYYNRNFMKDETTVESISSPFVKKADIAWFASHGHSAYPSENLAYQYSYIYRYRINIPKNTKSITLPDDESIRVFAISAVQENIAKTVCTQPLYEDFNYAHQVSIR